MVDVIDIGLVGAGFMGDAHSAAYRQIPNVRVKAICSRSRDKAEKMAEEWGANVYESLEEMLDEESIDAVDICTPTSTHRHMVETAAAYKKHVICEKPMATNEEDAEAMIESCRRAGVILMVAHVVRFNKKFLSARNLLLDGSLGKPGVVRISRVGEFPKWSSWYSNEAPGGTLLDLAIHDFDYLRWCLGPVQRVFSRQVVGDSLDHSLTLLRFASGAMAHVESSWAYPSGTELQVSLEIAGSNGVAQFERQKSYPVYTFREGITSADNPLTKNSYVRQLEHFIDCIRNNQSPLTSGEEGLESLRISLAAIQSATTGMPIELEVRVRE